MSSDPRTALGLVVNGTVNVDGPAVIHEAPALSFSEDNCLKAAGITVKAFRQLLRRGLRSVETRDGRVVLREDFVAFIRDRGDVLPAEPAKPKADDDDRALLKSAGVKLRSVGGSR